MPENSPKYAKFSFFEFASRSGAKKVLIFEFSSQIDAKKVATLRERVLFRRIQLSRAHLKLRICVIERNYKNRSWNSVSLNQIIDFQGVCTTEAELDLVFDSSTRSLEVLECCAD